MKKKIILGIMVAVLASAGGLSASVSAASGRTDVTGVVTNNYVPVANVSVSVFCNGNVATDTTDAQGTYLVNYLTTQCPFGSTVRVTAQKSGMSGIASDTVSGVTTKLNLAIVNVPIPEYGVLGTLMAGGVGIGIIAYRRHRQNQNQNQQQA